jgi:N-acetylglucosamine kinase-like BadF-type ATPase
MRVVPGNRRGERVLAAGVDIGGTWVRVALADGRRIRRRTTRVPELRKFLLTLADPSHGPLAALVVAARGAWTARERRDVARGLDGVARRIVVLSDVEAALLGALGGRPGLLILAGTGSIALGVDATGRWGREGGLGPLLGDDGSAFWMGREWLRATARGDAFLPARRLARAPDPVAKIAAVARLVLARARSGDRTALTIVRGAQTALADLGVAVTSGLHLPSPIDVSWAGRVMDDDWFRRGVVRALARRGVRARWRNPESEPVVAAARLAAQLAGGRTLGRPAQRLHRRERG